MSVDPLSITAGEETPGAEHSEKVHVSREGRPRTMVPLEEIAATVVPENPFATGPNDQYKKPEAAPATTTKYVREWQLTDEDGKPIGPPSRIEADSADELADKLVECNKGAARKLAEYRQKYRDSIVKEDPMDVPDLKPLSNEEKLEIRRLLDKPDTQEEGFDRLFKARVGITPQEWRQEMTEEAALVAKQQAYNEGVQFINETPDFPVGKAGMEAFKAYWNEKQEALRKEKNDPTFTIAAKKQNMKLIFEEAVDAGRMTRNTATSRRRPRKRCLKPTLLSALNLQVKMHLLTQR